MPALHPRASTWRLRCTNAAASLAFLAVAFAAYRYSPHTESLLLHQWSPELLLNGLDILTIGSLAYGLLLVVNYGVEKTPTESKSVAAVKGLRRLLTTPSASWRDGLPPQERIGLLTTALKMFFAPLMVLSLFDFTSGMATNAAQLAARMSDLTGEFLVVFNAHGFWFLFQAILFVDVLFYTIGYLVEHPMLRNEIRSVDSTIAGWAAALACYPPFNLLTVQVLGGSIQDFPQFENAAVHLTVNFTILLLMAVYASASVALNFKASNLTHRGVVSWGPYRYVRHPAYVCKNAAWWLGTLPALSTAWAQSAIEALLVIGAMGAWSALYVLRAITEEDHLRRVDAEYETYCRAVRHRFIPGLY